MIGDTLSSRSADTLSLLRQDQTSPAKADTDSLQLVDLHAVQEVDSGFEGTPISYSPRTDDAIALTLLACFFLSSIALARGKKFLSQQVKDFVLHRERTSIFDSSTAADVRYLLVLVLQTCVLSGITFLNYFHDTCPAEPGIPPPFAGYLRWILPCLFLTKMADLHVSWVDVF